MRERKDFFAKNMRHYILTLVSSIFVYLYIIYSMSSFTPTFEKTNMDMPYNVPVSHQTPPPIQKDLEKLPLQNLFGPLHKEYCIWFYFLSVIGFVFLILLLISGIIIGIYRKKGIDHYYLLFLTSVAYGIIYFQNRLLYGMCSKSL
jgi:hypothetical protein